MHKRTNMSRFVTLMMSKSLI